MALLKCLEPVVSIGCALFGVPPTVGAVASGGIKIASLFHESGVKHGFDSTVLMGKMQRAAFAAADRYDKNQDWRDALTEADTALTKFLPACVPTRPDIVECAREADFAEAVHRFLINRIADKDARFQTSSSIGIFCPRSFASDIIRAVLEASLADEKYAQSLALPLQLETVREVSNANVKLDRLLALVGGSTLPDQALRGAIARFVDFQPNALDADVLNAVATFERDYRALLEQVSHISVHDNHIQSLKVAAEEALEAGDIATARTRYAEAAKAATDKASEPVRNAAALKSAEASAALTMLDWQAADAAWEQAGAMLMPFDVEAGEAVVGTAADRLAIFGEIFAQNPALVASEKRLRALEAAAQHCGDAERAANIQNNLGHVLSVQGERIRGKKGFALLAEGIATFRTALSVYKQAKRPVEWARTQNNLGNALRKQGERKAGAVGLAILGKAIKAYRAALKIRTQAEMPAAWAMTQTNLGAAMAVLGHRTKDIEGLLLLAEAIEVYRAALTVYTKVATPARWANTQNVLGATLAMQGEKTGGSAGLSLIAKAVEACRAALTVHTHSAMPAEWAGTQHNLGNLLRSQGESCEGDVGLALLAEAVEAYQAALIVWTVKHFSHYHEMASNNLAQAEAVIAARRG